MIYRVVLKPAAGSDEAFVGALRHATRKIPAFTPYEDVYDYDHPDTGVRFQIEMDDPADRSADYAAHEDGAIAMIHLYYARPSLFGHEAANVLGEIAKNLPIHMLD